MITRKALRQAAFFTTVVASSSAMADMKDCDAFSLLAHNLMGARQNGVTMKQSMEVAEKNSRTPELEKFMRGMVIDAYEVPGYSTEAVKQKAITDFENKYYMQCAKAQA